MLTLLCLQDRRNCCPHRQTAHTETGLSASLQLYACTRRQQRLCSAIPGACSINSLYLYLCKYMHVFFCLMQAVRVNHLEFACYAASKSAGKCRSNSITSFGHKLCCLCVIRIQPKHSGWRLPQMIGLVVGVTIEYHTMQKSSRMQKLVGRSQPLFTKSDSFSEFLSLVGGKIY